MSRQNDPDIERLLALLDGPPTAGRARAIVVLGMLRVADAVPALARIGGTGGASRDTAIIALGWIGGPAACAILRDVLDAGREASSEPDESVAIQIVAASRPGDSALAPSIAPYAESSRRRIREAAIAGLLSLEGPAAKEAIHAQRLLTREGWRSRRRIRRQAEELRWSRCVDDPAVLAHTRYVMKVTNAGIWRAVLTRPPPVSRPLWWLLAVPALVVLATIPATVVGLFWAAMAASRLRTRLLHHRRT